MKVDIEKIKSKILFIRSQRMGRKTTVVMLTMENGMEIIGSSACVNPDDYNEKRGEEIAYENALKKLIEMEAYMLSELQNTEKHL